MCLKSSSWLTVLHKVNLWTHLLRCVSKICDMHYIVGIFYDREIGDAKGKANRSTSRGEDDTSSRYAFLYYSVRLDTDGLWADEGKENLHAKEFTSKIRCNISWRNGSSSSVLLRQKSTIYIEVAVRYSKETTWLLRNSAEKWNDITVFSDNYAILLWAILENTSFQIQEER